MNLLPPPAELALFVTAATLLLLIPGPAVLYIVARSMNQGPGAGLASSAGIAVGGLVHVIAAAFGLSALLMSSAAAYSVIQYAGAVYLLYLGIKKLRERAAVAPAVAPAPRVPLRRIFAQGIAVNLLNPKTALFFFAFLPQFVSPSRGSAAMQFLMLGVLFTLMGLVSDSLWAVASGYASGWLKRHQGFVRGERYLTGTVYLGLGVAAAVSGSRAK